MPQCCGLNQPAGADDLTVSPAVWCRKQTCYRLVLQTLDAEMSAATYKHLATQLAAVVDPDKSSVFEEIVY